MKSLPLHASQRLLEEHDEYADFEVYLAPTYDFIMRLLHTGAMIEVISPASLRQTMKEWISDMYELYKMINCFLNSNYLHKTQSTDSQYLHQVTQFSPPPSFTREAIFICSTIQFG